MPTIIPHLQKGFKLSLKGGQPEGVVEGTHGTYLMQCCPLCGCSHQIISTDRRNSYMPLCQLLPLLFKVQRAAWIKLHPEVEQFKSVHLTESMI